MNSFELARELLRVFHENGPMGVLERYQDLFTDDFEFRPPITEVTGGPAYVGREGFERYVNDVEEILSDVRPGGSFDELTEIVPGVLRSRVTMHGEGIRSGAIVDAPITSIIRARSGRICWWWATYDPAAAERVSDAIARGEEVSV